MVSYFCELLCIYLHQASMILYSAILENSVWLRKASTLSLVVKEDFKKLTPPPGAHGTPLRIKWFEKFVIKRNNHSVGGCYALETVWYRTMMAFSFRIWTINNASSLSNQEPFVHWAGYKTSFPSMEYYGKITIWKLNLPRTYMMKRYDVWIKQNQSYCSSSCTGPA